MAQLRRILISASTTLLQLLRKAQLSIYPPENFEGCVLLDICIACMQQLLRGSLVTIVKAYIEEEKQHLDGPRPHG